MIIDVIGVDGKLKNQMSADLSQDTIDIVPYPPGKPCRVFTTMVGDEKRFYIVVDE